MIDMASCHKLWQAKVKVEPNIEELYYVVAANLQQATYNATQAFNVVHGSSVDSSIVVEIALTTINPWIDEKTIG